LRSTAKGFVPMRAAGNILISFSTRPGQVAKDANIFSSALANELRQPGAPPYSVFKRTQLAVNRLTRGRQVPWLEDGLLVEGFQFKAAPQRTAAIVPPKKQPGDTASMQQPIKPHKPLKPGTSFRDCDDVCPEMVVVPAGSFMMGSPSSEKGRNSDEGPQRRVTISKPFAVGKYEVTWDEWEACVADNGCDASGPEKAGGDNDWGRGRRPVIEVSWGDAIAYAGWLSKKTGEDYRLLSEAEWEYAARAGTTGRWSFKGGESELCRYANHADRQTGYSWRNTKCSDGIGKKTAEVGGYKANPWGLYDMHGNVWEWVQDCFGDYKEAPSDGTAKEQPNCTSRVLRGGSWLNDPQNLRSAGRYGGYAGGRDGGVGFRVVRMLKS